MASSSSVALAATIWKRCWKIYDPGCYSIKRWGTVRSDMRTLDEVKRFLSAHKATLRARYKARELAIFGSLLRAEQEPANDVDILVDFDEGADLFDLTGLAQFLEEELNCSVDVVPKRALREEIRDAVLKEAVQV